jgi:hypothetical protein
VRRYVGELLDGASEFDGETGRSRQREEMEVLQDNEGLKIHYFGDKISSPEELIKSAKIDERIWEVAKVTINNWGVAGKLKRGQNEQGKWNPEELWQQQLRQIKVELRRRAPKFVQDAIEGLLADWKPRKLAAPKRRADSDPHLLDVSLHDAHFGKLAWGMETGKDFDLKIIEADYCGAIDDMLHIVRHWNIERIQMVVGSDCFHVDNIVGTTTKGTRVDSTDDRLSKVFEVVFRCLEYAARRFREVADVELFYVPGNHDYTTAWHLCLTLGAAFQGDEHVAVDYTPSPRKYRTYGPTLMGYDHGDECALDKLPLIMATDGPDLWAASTYRRWFTGHRHKRAKFKYTASDTFNGVEVHILPSLSGTDLWHFRKGFVNNIPMAQCDLYSKASGPVGQFVVTARSERG